MQRERRTCAQRRSCPEHDGRLGNARRRVGTVGGCREDAPRRPHDSRVAYGTTVQPVVVWTHWLNINAGLVAEHRPLVTDTTNEWQAVLSPAAVTVGL